MYPVAILVGGLGSRIAHLSPGLPKALMPISNRPFIDYKLADLAIQGVERVVLIVGYRADAIRHHVGNGEKYRLEVSYVQDAPQLLGTGGAVRSALEKLGKVFWLTYGDNFLPARMAPVERSFRAEELLGMMTVYKNSDMGDRSNLSISQGRVVAYDKASARGTFDYIDYGMTILRETAFDGLERGKSFDLSEVYLRLISARAMGAFEVREPFYEIGSPAGYDSTVDLLSGEHGQALVQAIKE